MGRVAFVFPGQGAQCIGMARDFYENFEESRHVFATASEVCGYAIEDICFKENEKINQTRYTQPALLTAGCAVLAAVQKADIQADMTAGLSLGEYCALTAARALNFETAIGLVRERGIFMEEAVPAGQGSMMAILSRRDLPIETICEETEGIVGVANYNCPGQRVISGEKAAVEAAAAKLLEAGALRAVPLKVSGPFHSPMLQEAGQRLRQLLETADIRVPAVPFVSNVTAMEVAEPDAIRDLLGQQVCSPVRWEQSVRYMIDQGVDMFVELGPGSTLGGLIRKIDRSVKVFHVADTEDLYKLKAAMQER